MSNAYQIAVVGSGPSGLSAAARAAEKGLSHILLEASSQPSNTIFKYQKGKHVMAEPGILPLRSPLSFEAGTREKVLDTWNSGVAKLKVNIQYNSEVTVIEGKQGEFRLKLKNGDTMQAANVVFAIGLQGNIRKLGVPGEDLPQVQYQLDDPKEYADETIVVVGPGDAGIENAVALSEQNRVIMINRGDDFMRAKEGNNNAIMAKIKSGAMDCFYGTDTVRVEAVTDAEKSGVPPLLYVCKTPKGNDTVACHRIIARLGAIPARKFVESCGIVFPNNDPAAVPQLSETYESNVKGLYIIGALGGYPLIKQAMNQGYEVIEYTQGNKLEPADEPLLKSKFKNIKSVSTVAEALDLIQRNVPVLSGITTLQVREFMLDSEVRTPKEGEVIFAKDDYTNSFFSIVTGEVHVQTSPDDPKTVTTIGQGRFFGEMGLISGRRRTATVRAGKNCVLIETPRRSMNKLINSVESVKKIVDEVFLRRTIQTHLAPDIPFEQLANLVTTAAIKKYSAGDVIFHEGDACDGLYLVRRGSVTTSRKVAGHDIVLSYLAAGNYFGEMALMSDTPRSATVRAAVATEAILLEAAAFKALLEQMPDLRVKMETTFQQRLAANVAMESASDSGNIISFLVKQGLGEATDVLLIDESLCVRCNNCEVACAETHIDGISRLNREAGPTFASIHVPTSCRHCEHPHCMKDCPPDAIHRSPNGEVFITSSCIGCGNCERNCPYGVIQMEKPHPRKPGLLPLLSSLVLGWEQEMAYDPNAPKKAVKCDMCRDLPGGPACVRACPTGAAIRVRPEEFMSFLKVS